MNTVTITIDSCTDCTLSEKSDGRYGAFNYYCWANRKKGENPKAIASLHENGFFCAIPDWCPLLKKGEN